MISDIYIGNDLTAKLASIEDPLKDPEIYNEITRNILRGMGIKDQELIKEVASWETYAYYQYYSGCTTMGLNRAKSVCEKSKVEYSEFNRRKCEVIRSIS